MAPRGATFVAKARPVREEAARPYYRGDPAADATRKRFVAAARSPVDPRNRLVTS
jgi:hypothetical protein